MRRDRLYAWLVAHPRAVDTAIAVVLLVAATAPIAGMGVRVLQTSLLLIAPLAWRRAHPVVVVTVVFAVAFGQWLLALSDPRLQMLPADAAVLVALYAVAAYGPRRASRLALAGAAVGALLLAVAVARHETVDAGHAGLAVFCVSGALALAAWALGDLRRIRGAYVASLEERTRRLELEREQQAQLAAATERARIARELHDVVAHSLSVVVAQADGGRYAAARSPEAAEGALATISATGRSALADMRRLLGVLRDDATGGTAPQPVVADIAPLVESVRDSGLHVQLVESGAPQPVEPGLSLAGYRIVQEALTNVLKHAGPGTAATVAVAWTPHGLDLTVEDEGTSVPEQRLEGTGHGHLGMHERAALYGGTVDVGPRVGGGYRVHAHLPARPERVRAAH